VLDIRHGLVTFWLYNWKHMNVLTFATASCRAARFSFTKQTFIFNHNRAARFSFTKQTFIFNHNRAARFSFTKQTFIFL
jgi:hypothetical protein